MFIVLGKKQCPSCGIDGKKWRQEKDVYECPSCSMIFNEFGIIAQREEKKEMLS